jgi:hypothetical protein
MTRCKSSCAEPTRKTRQPRRPILDRTPEHVEGLTQ